MLARRSQLRGQRRNLRVARFTGFPLSFASTRYEDHDKSEYDELEKAVNDSSGRLRLVVGGILPIELDAKLDRLSPAGAAVGIGIAQRIDAAAIFLLVEFLALADIDHAGGTAALAPIVVPVLQSLVFRGCALSAIVDLRHVLPARDTERTRYHRKAVLMRIERGALKAHVKAHGAACAALRLPLHALGSRKPVVLVVVSIDETNAMLLGKAHVLILAQKIFALRMDVRVVEEDGVVDAGGEHRLHHLARARRAARMQQNLLLPIGRIEDRSDKIIHHGARLSEPLSNESLLIRKAQGPIRRFRAVPWRHGKSLAAEPESPHSALL